MMKVSTQNCRRITIGAVAFAALLTASIGRAHAQTMPAPGAPTPTTDRRPTLLVDEQLDYSKLYNPYYDYFDIVSAKAHGFRDDDVAKAVKIAEKTRFTFQHVVDLKFVGRSWSQIADEAGLPNNGLKNVDKEKDEVAAYEAAFFATGFENQRRDSEASIRGEAMYGNRDGKK